MVAVVSGLRPFIACEFRDAGRFWTLSDAIPGTASHEERQERTDGDSKMCLVHIRVTWPLWKSIICDLRANRIAGAFHG